jgi:hypothetical protein
VKSEAAPASVVDTTAPAHLHSQYSDGLQRPSLPRGSLGLMGTICYCSPCAAAICVCLMVQLCSVRMHSASQVSALQATLRGWPHISGAQAALYGQRHSLWP